MVNVIRNWSVGFDNITSPDQFLTQMNTNLNYWLGIVLLTSVFTILLLLLSTVTSGKKAFSSASFVSSLIAWLLWIVGWISTFWFVLFIVMAVIGAVSLFVNPE